MRILLAEDETELGTWLTKALAQSDFQVDWVNDGRLVRRSLKATKYDALILDLGLPGLGGHVCEHRVYVTCGDGRAWEGGLREGGTGGRHGRIVLRESGTVKPEKRNRV